MPATAPTEPSALAVPAVGPRPGLGTIGILAIGLTLLAWASAFVVIRQVATTIHPGALAFGRFAVGSAALGVALIALRRRWVRPTRAEWLRLIGCGLTWFTGYALALNTGEQRVEAGTSSMIVNVGPIFLVLLAVLFLKERPTRWMWMGLPVAFGGAILIGLAKVGTQTSLDVSGVLLCVLAALCYAVGVTLQKPVLAHLPALQTTFICVTVGVLTTAPFAGQLVGDYATSGASVFWNVLYLGLIPTAVAFGTWSYALGRIDAGRLGVTTYIVPVLTIGLAWLMLREVPPALALVGGAACLVGVAITRKR